MRVRTLGIVSAAGMMLTSLTVWSVTAPDSRTVPEVTESPAESTPIAAVSGAEFTAGRTLMVEGRLGHTRLLAGQPNETYLFVDVEASPDASARSAPPLSLAIVIDRSGSMKGRRLRNAKDAAAAAVRQLRDGDLVSVITYDTESRVLVAPVAVNAASRSRIIRRLDEIEARGDTCISCGLDGALASLGRQARRVSRVLLLSDGEATAGVRDLGGFRRIADRARDRGVSISSIGVDLDYNERVLSILATGSNGMHHFVENPVQLASVFQKELDSLTRTVANDTEVTVELAPGVEVERVFDRGFRRDGRRVIVSMGSFSKSEKKTVLLKLRLPGADAGEQRVADVRLAFEDLVDSTGGRCEGSLATMLTDDAASVSDLDALVAGRIGRAETAAALKTANDQANAGDLFGARRTLGNKLRELSKRRQRFAAAAPKKAKPKVDRDFKAQTEALDQAKNRFDSLPDDGDAEKSAPGKSSIKENEAAANPFEL